MQLRQEVYDIYWRFAAMRQDLFYQRIDGQPAVASDPILAKYKFCNVYRAADRVSQFLIREVIYNQPASSEDQLFRIFLFRLLNRSQTWQQLEAIVGPISLQNFTPDSYSKALSSIRQTQPIYGNAFILCANKAYGHDRKQDNHLALLKDVFIQRRLSQKLLKSQSLEQLYLGLRQLPLIGDFMAYQLAIDFNYSEAFNFSENDFTIAGPGAHRGIAKCFTSTSNHSSQYVIMHMVENQTREFERLGLNFKGLWGRPLQAIDCQGLFCEVDKYCRVKYPKLASNRSRIKSSYTPTPHPISYFFPPKWAINRPLLVGAPTNQ